MKSKEIIEIAERYSDSPELFINSILSLCYENSVSIKDKKKINDLYEKYKESFLNLCSSFGRHQYI